MPQEKVPINVRTNDAHLLTAPPGSLEGPPISRSNETGDINPSLADMDRSAPSDIVNGAIKFIIVLRHTLTTKPSDPGGPQRSKLQATCFAHVRSSDFVSRSSAPNQETPQSSPVTLEVLRGP
jgi:hypothetical protein